jgi:hypothetical protein
MKSTRFVVRETRSEPGGPVQDRELRYVEPTADGAAFDLASRWEITPALEGGVNLRVSPRGRMFVVGGAAALALGWIGRSAYALESGEPLPLQVSLSAAIGIGCFLMALFMWIAFARDGWHIAPNCAEHRVGIGPWSHVRRFRDATLQVVCRFDKWSRPYYRLYAVVDGEPHFLLERRLPELSAWADLVAAQTGWPRRDA